MIAKVNCKGLTDVISVKILHPLLLRKKFDENIISTMTNKY